MMSTLNALLLHVSLPYLLHTHSLSVAFLKHLCDFARVHNIEQYHDCEHQDRIKDVQEDLVPQQIPVVAHEILNHPEDRPHEDQHAHAHEHPEMLTPGHRVVDTLGRRLAVYAGIKQRADEHEEAEESQLDKKTGDDHLLARMHTGFRAASHDASAARLDHEGDDIAGDEYFSQPLLSDQRVLLAIGDHDNATEDHVN